MTLRALSVLAPTLLAVVATHPAAAQESGLESRVPADVLAAVGPTLEAARRDSLPVAALESKVLEGVAKGVPPARIGTALSALAREYRDARGALRTALPQVSLHDGEVASAALAIRQGVPAERLVGLWEDRPEQASLEIPLAVTGELARRGVDPGEAVGLMRHVLSSRTPMSTAAQIPARVDIHLQGPGGPGAAVREALRSLGIPDPPGRPGGPPRGPPGNRRPGG